MKRASNLYDKICDIDTIGEMCDLVCKKVKNKQKAENFMMFKAEHVVNIKNRLINMDLNLSRYNIFFITDPKCRVIMSQNIEDKVINHLIAEYFLVQVFERTYTNGMCATRIGFGTSYGINLLKKYINELKLHYNNFYVLKLDIKKYFYNIDHDVLKNILRSKIKDMKVLYVLDKVIDSTNKKYINNSINKLKVKRIEFLKERNYLDKIKEVEEIPLYKHNKGCAIGNQTSQAFGLIYLNGINHFMKEELHLKYVVNYMDDFIIMHPDKEYLNNCFRLIKEKLYDDYKLELNMKKSKIESIKVGIDFLGYNFIIKNNKIILRLRTRTKNKLRKKVNSLKLLLNNNYINKEIYNRLLSSYKGILMKGNCNYLYYKYLKV